MGRRQPHGRRRWTADGAGAGCRGDGGYLRNRPCRRGRPGRTRLPGCRARPRRSRGRRLGQGAVGRRRRTRPRCERSRGGRRVDPLRRAGPVRRERGGSRRRGRGARRRRRRAGRSGPAGARRRRRRHLLRARAAARSLSDSGGSMVFTLSDASFLVRGNGAGIVYAAAKHAALGVVRQLAADLAPAVRVNAVAPGGIVTGLRTVDGRQVYADPDEITATVRAFNPLGVMPRAEQVAPLYRFLASPVAAGMTGEVLRPDGGLTVR
ncbi:SDR family oxidoreductase [Streptomyces antimycoticus]|nr:SDR family oxidoreductase [Streptomyces antimycoticus]WJE00862.1 SDR family oxidoreductase [Streptomyces antimycoticus]